MREFMGLLEKASNIQNEDASPPTKVIEQSKPAPTPIQEVVKEPVAKAKPAKKVKAKKTRVKKEKKPRVKKVMPEGFEPATTGQKLTRKLVDFIVSYGWSVPIIAITAWGSYFNPTIFVILGLVLMGFNLFFMPSRTSRTVGNWISRTRYVNTRGESPFWFYSSIKGLTFVFIILGTISLFTIMSEFPETTMGQIFMAIGILLLIPPLVDYIMYRVRGDLGLWDSLFGGVWLVRTTKSKEAKGWLKRLESISDWTESKGLLDEQKEES